MNCIEKVYDAFSDVPCPEDYNWTSAREITTKYLCDNTIEWNGLDEYFFSRENSDYVIYLTPRVIELKTQNIGCIHDWEGLAKHLLKYGFDEWPTKRKNAIQKLYLSQIQKSAADDEFWNFYDLLKGGLALSLQPKPLFAPIYLSSSFTIKVYESISPDLKKYVKSNKDDLALEIIINWFKSEEFNEVLSHAYESKHS